MPRAVQTRTRPPRPKPARRGLWIGLIASISVNILLVSFVATLLWRLDMPLLEATNPLRVVNRASALLSDEDRAHLEAAYASRQAAFDEAERQVVAARGRVLALMAAPVLDEAAIRAAIEEGRVWRRTSTDLLVDTILDTLKAMPAERRQEIVGKFPQR